MKSIEISIGLVKYIYILFSITDRPSRQKIIENIYREREHKHGQLSQLGNLSMGKEYLLYYLFNFSLVWKISK